jgi:uncharacterized protein
MLDNEWMAPSARLWRMRLTQACVVGAAVALVAGITAVLAGGGAGTGALAAVIAVAVAAVAVVCLRNRYRSWAYRERAEDLIVARGVLVRRVSVVPYGRMSWPRSSRWPRWCAGWSPGGGWRVARCG